MSNIHHIYHTTFGGRGRKVKISEMEAALKCTHCHDETIHRITYLNGKIRKVECTECKNNSASEKIDAKKELFKEVYDRISTKPSRITKEYKADLNSFIYGFPPRVIRKPFGLLKFLNETKEAFKKSKDI